jgi:transglutaminase-like putative cysteine protease
MLCGGCGVFLSDDITGSCPSCGYELDSPLPSFDKENTVKTPIETAEKKRSRRKDIVIRAAAVCIIMGLASCTVFAVISYYTEDSYKKIETRSITDDAYFELSGDFLTEKGILTVDLSEKNELVFELDDAISSEYDYFSWRLFDYDHSASVNPSVFVKYMGETTDTTSHILNYPSQNDASLKAGKYEISVKCYVDADDGRHIYTITYSGTVNYVGTVTEEYKWKYLGKVYSAEVAFGYDEYRHYRDMNTRNRAVAYYSKVVSFVTYDDPIVKALAASLQKAYGTGRDLTGQTFAYFVLGFVQICFDYPPYSGSMLADKYLYGQDEYFAYPMETIFYGMGDCEDTSILAAALFKALGYSAGVEILPEHAIAAVGLSSYDPGIYPTSSFEVMSQTVDGITYYGCETTTTTPINVGLVKSSGYDGHPYSWYVGKHGYGLYVV